MQLVYSVDVDDKQTNNEIQGRDKARLIGHTFNQIHIKTLDAKP
jgi:hypothetical protein